MRRGALLFAAGFGLALAAGWVAFPRALYLSRSQPLEFPHKTHAEKAGTSGCSDCHSLAEDGSFTGIPPASGCSTCHAEPLGTTQAEATLVNSYLKPGNPVPWLVYSRQPANVRFSHAIHAERAKLGCEQCHGNHGQSDRLREYQQNRISGYSRDIWGSSMSRLRRAPGDGMKMSDCESCHRERGVEAGCLGCHR
jgi:hypothetical protein